MRRCPRCGVPTTAWYAARLAWHQLLRVAIFALVRATAPRHS